MLNEISKTAILIILIFIFTMLVFVYPEFDNIKIQDFIDKNVFLLISMIGYFIIAISVTTSSMRKMRQESDRSISDLKNIIMQNNEDLKSIIAHLALNVKLNQEELSELDRKVIEIIQKNFNIE